MDRNMVFYRIVTNICKKIRTILPEIYFLLLWAALGYFGLRNKTCVNTLSFFPQIRNHRLTSKCSRK